MPRYSTGKTKIKTVERIRRSNTQKIEPIGKFIDPFPLGFGTLPEKIVYAALSRRGIPFLYLNDIRLVIPEIDFDQYYQADFIIPDLRIIIEVQGAHWHSMPNTIAEDAFKFALYQQTGWTPLAWWDFDILDNVNNLFALTPQLNQYGTPPQGLVSSELAVQRRTKTDSSQGIRTLNAKRGARLTYRKKPVTIKSKKRKGYGSYATTTR